MRLICSSSSFNKFDVTRKLLGRSSMKWPQRQKRKNIRQDFLKRKSTRQDGFGSDECERVAASG